MNTIVKKRRPEETVYLKGTSKWVKHLQPDFQFEPGGKWSMVLYLTGDELEKARKLQSRGIKNQIKFDETENGWYITLSRKCQYEVRGRVVGREPPRVFRMEGEVEVPITVAIGNGSSGITKCILWSSPNFPGSNLRWEAYRVDNFIPFSPEADYVDGGAGLVELKQQEEELF